MKKIGLVCAMEVEADILIKQLSLSKIDNKNNIYINNEQNIVLIICGIGLENAAINTQLLIGKYNLNEILNFGYVGSNTIKESTIVAPNLVYNKDFDLTIMGYKKYQIPNIIDLKLNVIDKYINCTCYSANYFVTNSDEEEPVIFDMELHGIAMACNKNEVSLSSIKIVTDCLDAKVYNDNEENEDFKEMLSKEVGEYIKTNYIDLNNTL